MHDNEWVSDMPGGNAGARITTDRRMLNGFVSQYGEADVA